MRDGEEHSATADAPERNRTSRLDCAPAARRCHRAAWAVLAFGWLSAFACLISAFDSAEYFVGFIVEIGLFLACGAGAMCAALHLLGYRLNARASRSFAP